VFLRLLRFGMLWFGGAIVTLTRRYVTTSPCLVLSLPFPGDLT
jgi:hypothetical protein